MTREEKLYAMTGATLIKVADDLGIKVAANKTRTSLKEAKSKVIERILAAETNEPSPSTPEETTSKTISKATKTTKTTKATSEDKPATTTKRTNLKLDKLTYNGETKSIREWANELEMPWPTLYDRVNRNGWTVEEAIEIPLGQRRKKA